MGINEQNTKFWLLLLSHANSRVMLETDGYLALNVGRRFTVRYTLRFLEERG